MTGLRRVMLIACFAGFAGAAMGAIVQTPGRAGDHLSAVAPAAAPPIPDSSTPPREKEDSAPAPGGDAASPGGPEAIAPEQARRQRLDDLFTRLAASTDLVETNGLVAAIDRLQLESGSNTGDYLMSRAVAAIGARDLETSLVLLDKIIDLQPDWAEAWNKRATARYLAGDDQGSMSDIAHVLTLEPRHFGALSGMGMILERRGFRDQALRAYKRALEVAPQLPSLRSAVDRLTAAAHGQDL